MQNNLYLTYLLNNININFVMKCKTNLLSFFTFHFSPLTLLLFISVL